ncbi:peptide/nickel transport system substrate-binding protein [Streptosporangium becharense]|uniref:Peptide/nickel transport system substrate-binding protein n=1 Tax=Streptosporangium becharense TaxID=1816182 RepID=A0A7W9MHF1_9ACTN|nr:ABC transporter substrate-binding protein [Streptosporangium becharense]MBB2914796.1 peptide/nickel transport system substrate-binding protein [Streptosporangium becharense]MBB5820393.1 peptide/nickel transport system substrate-binding protein [Streptosporangium becharense]
MHSLNRRAFLGATAGLSAALLTGCGSGPATGTAATGGPRKGGRLRVAFAGGGAQETLDPHLSNLFVEASRSKAMFDKLADYGPDLSVRPRLAERWEADAGLTTWRVTLRQAGFHNGKPVRAADVLSSYARIADPARAFRAKTTLAVIDLKRSRAVDDRTVEFALKQPFAEFPNVLAAFGVFIVPEGTEDFTRPVGSGPFSFVSFEPGRSLLLKRNADYWEGAPHVDELQYLISNEESARVNALLGGQVDYAHDITATTARTYQGNDRLAVTRLTNSGMQAFAMKLDRAPFNDPGLREAMFLLADRGQLVDTVLAGAGQVGNDLFGRGYQYYAEEIPQRTRDLEKAKWLVEKAGAKGMKIQLDTSAAASGFVESASVFADQMRQAGLDVNVAMGNKDTYWKDILDKGSLCCFRSGAMPIETHFAQRLLSTSTVNVTKWKRPEFDALYTKAVSLADEKARRDVYAEMQRMQHAEGGYLVWGFADWLVATSPRVGGIADAPANTLDWARFDKVWLA